MDGPGFGEEEEPLHTILGKVHTLSIKILLFYLKLFYNFNFRKRGKKERF